MKFRVFLLLTILSSVGLASDNVGFDARIVFKHEPYHDPDLPAGSSGIGTSRVKKVKFEANIDYCVEGICQVLSQVGYVEVKKNREESINQAIERYRNSFEQKVAEVQKAIQDLESGKDPRYGKIGQEFKEVSNKIGSLDQQTKTKILQVQEDLDKFKKEGANLAKQLGEEVLPESELEDLSNSAVSNHGDFAETLNSLSRPMSGQFNGGDFTGKNGKPIQPNPDDFIKKVEFQELVNQHIRQTIPAGSDITRNRMIDASDRTLSFAEYFYNEGGDPEIAEEYLNLALNFADMALGFVPLIGQVYGFASDGYQVLFGENMLSGESLTTSDRVIAGVGLVSGGLLSRGIKIIKGLPKLADSAILIPKVADELKDIAQLVIRSPASKEIVEKGAKWGFKHGDEMAEHADVIAKMGTGKVSKLEHADDVNASFIKNGDQPPYKANTKIVKFTTTEPEVFVRVHGANNQPGVWMMRKGELEGLSPVQIKEKFNLPSVPTKVSEVKVPAGTDIRSGMIGKNKYGNSEGAVQYEILMPDGNKIPPRWFNEIGSF